MHYQTDAKPLPAAALRSQAPILVLYLLDAFALGGCVALLAVHQVILAIMNRIEAAAAAGQLDSLRAANAAGDYVDVLDHLFPFYLAYGVPLLALALLTLGVWTWRGLSKVRKT